jgi:hypothetical protein
MGFEEVLEEDDYGIIVGKDGSLKGIWIPQHLEDEDELPESITQIIRTVFGIDPNAEETQATIH